MDSDNIKLRFQKAVDSFIEKVKADSNVTAVIVFGSYSYDTVWEKSDIDIMVIIRGQKIETNSYCIDEDNLVINIDLTHQGSPPLLSEAQAGVDLLISVGVQAPTENRANPGMGYE